TGFVMLLGEITTNAFVDFDALVREVVNDIGFDDSAKGFDGHTCGVQVAVASQSPDIAMGVDRAKEYKDGSLDMEDDEIEATGAGDQGMMFGFACNETATLMPMPIYYAHKLVRRMAEVRKNGTLPWLRPDSKSQVTVEYSYGKPKRIHTVLISTQHAPEISQEEIRQALIEHVIDPVLPAELVDKDMLIYT
ncbi:MAG: methionine adenosyltransferase, partial [Anaerolineae bacterium]|nr:methionine adenosyltransferase [Anaerolineae bacterium]